MHSTSQRIFSGLAGSYDLAVDCATLLQDRRWKNWATRAAGIGPGRVTLDVGCGTLLLEDRVKGTRSRFVGLDLSREMLILGRAKGLGNTDLMVNGDAESLPFPDAFFDSVVSCYVAKYVRVPRFAGELARVTKVGGMVALYDFARPKGPLAPFIDLYAQGGLRIVGSMLRLAGRGSAFTYSALPGIIEEATWDKKIAKEMEEKGFQTVAARRLTAGAVFAYCGRRLTSP